MGFIDEADYDEYLANRRRKREEERQAATPWPQADVSPIMPSFGQGPQPSLRSMAPADLWRPPTPIPSQEQIYAGLRQARQEDIYTPPQQKATEPDAITQAWEGFNQRFVEPPKTALGYTLDILQRPNYASAGIASENVKPTTRPDAGPIDRAGALLEAGRKGLMGEERKTYSDVLGEAGMEPGLLRNVLGFAADIGLDPTTYFTLGAGGVAKAGAKAGSAALKANIPFTKAEKTLVQGDTVGAIVDAFGKAIGKVPGVQGGKDILGEALVSNYALKSTGYGDVAEQLRRTRLTPKIAAEEAKRLAQRKFGPLTEQQREAFFEFADKGLEATLGPGKTAKDITDDGIQTVYQWYTGEYQPWLRSIKEEMGLDSFLDDYIRHVFPEKLKPGQTRVGRPPTKRDPGSFKARTGTEGFSTDPRVAIGFDYAETMVRKATNDFINNTINQYGRKLKPKDAIPEGMAEYFPQGRLQFYRGEVDSAQTLLRQAGQGSKLLEPELTQVGKVIDLAEQFGIPVVKNNRLRTALGRFVSRGQGLGPAKIELKSFTGDTAAHEFGHLYDWVLGGPASQKVREVLKRDWGAFGRKEEGGQFFRELYESPLAQRLPEKASGKLYRATPQELFAEWFNAYIRQPEEAARQAPGFTQYFSENILKPEHAEKISDLRDFASSIEQLPNPAPALRALSAQPEYFEKALRTLLEKKYFMGVRQGQRYALPEPIVKALNDFTSPGDTASILKAYDTVQGIWKGSVTSYFPEFHARNMLGNFYNNWLAGIYDPRDYLAASRLQQAARTGDFNRAGSIGEVPAEQLYRQMERTGTINTGFYGGEIAEELKKVPGSDTSRIKQALSAGRTVGEALENNAKIAHVIGQLKRGLSLDDAMSSARKYLFDYTDLSPFEKGVMRRVIPFYTWTRKNIPLQIEAMIKEPRKPLGVQKARDVASQDEDYRAEMELAPNYVVEQLNIVTGKDEQGNLRVLSGIGLPIEDLNRFFKLTPKRTVNQLAAMGSPLLRIPVELITNHSFFTGKPITDDATNNYYRRANSVLAGVPGLRDWLEIEAREYKDPKTGQTRIAYSADPVKNYAFLAVLGRAATTAGKFATEQRSIPGAIAEITIPGKEYIVDPTRAIAPFTQSMAKVQESKASNLDALAKDFFAGKLQGRDAREVRSRILGEVGQEMQLLQEQTAAKEAEYIPDLAGKQKIREQILPEGERLLAEYYDMKPGVTEPIGDFIKRMDKFRETLNPEQQQALDDAKESSLKRLEERSPEAAKMERDYREAIEEYKNYREIEELSGLSRNILDLSAEFAQQKRDTARSVPGVPGDKVEAILAAVNPDGALAYKAKRLFDQSPKGKALQKARRQYWASHSSLQRWFSDSVLVEEVE